MLIEKPYPEKKGDESRRLEAIASKLKYGDRFVSVGTWRKTFAHTDHNLGGKHACLKELLAAWSSGNANEWSQALATSARALEAIRMIVEGIQRLKQDESPVRVLTTNMLKYRIWPKIASGMAKAIASAELEVASHSLTDKFLLNELIQPSSNWDILISYADEETIDDILRSPHKSVCGVEQIEMRRCLLLPAGSIANARRKSADIGRCGVISTTEEFVQLTREMPIAALYSFDLLYGTRIKQVCKQSSNAALTHFRSTMELHSFVHNRFGCCITHFEAMGDEDTKALDWVELDSTCFGRSYFCLAWKSRMSQDENGGIVMDAFRYAVTGLKQWRDEFSYREYLAKYLGSVSHLYCINNESLDEQTVADSELWGVRVEMRVSPHGAISGSLVAHDSTSSHLFGAVNALRTDAGNRTLELSFRTSPREKLSLWGFGLCSLRDDVGDDTREFVPMVGRWSGRVKKSSRSHTLMSGKLVLLNKEMASFEDVKSE